MTDAEILDKFEQDVFGDGPGWQIDKSSGTIGKLVLYDKRARCYVFGNTIRELLSRHYTEEQ